MTIIGFTFSEIQAKQQKPPKGSIRINNNIKIVNLEKTSLNFDEKKIALKVDFKYTVDYQPEIGFIKFGGEILLLEDSKLADNLVKQWDEKKSLPPDFSEAIMSHLMQKCSVEAILLSKDVGLPSPIPLPKFKKPRVVKKKKEEDETSSKKK